MRENKRELQPDEVRALRIGEEAIVELLWETLQDMGESLFDLPEDSDAMYHMRWDREKMELVLYATDEMQTIKGGKEWNASVDAYIQKHVPITAGSLYDDFLDMNVPKYVSFHTERMTDYFDQYVAPEILLPFYKLLAFSGTMW